MSETTTPARNVRASLADVEREKARADAAEQELMEARVQADEDAHAHRNELARVRHALAVMVLSCGVTLDDLVRAAAAEGDQ